MSENGLHKIPAMRAALEAIQKRHEAVHNGYDIEGNSDYSCYECGLKYPCPTRRLADQGLGDNLARTTKNGENNA